MEKDIKKALHDYYSGSSKGPEATSSDKTQEAKTSDEWTKVVLLYVLGQILGEKGLAEMTSDKYMNPKMARRIRPRKTGPKSRSQFFVPLTDDYKKMRRGVKLKVLFYERNPLLGHEVS
jgi:hypothetical protein